MVIEPQKFSVFPANDLRVIDGVAIGDPVSVAADVVMDDIYRLDRTAEPVTVLLNAGHLSLAACGTALTCDARLTFMTTEGVTENVLVLRSTAAVYVLPLGALHPTTLYRLIASETGNLDRCLAMVGCAAFISGAQVTMADGTLRPIGMIRAGDHVLTRCHGSQTVRHVAHDVRCDRRGPGSVVIGGGALGNKNRLVLHPAQQIMLPSGRADMTTADDLVDGRAVTREHIGTAEFVQLLFDQPCEIFVEGIAVQSHLMDQRVSQRAPADDSRRLAGRQLSAHEVAALVQQATAYGAVAANVPSNMSKPAVSETVPKTTPDTASARRPRKSPAMSATMS